LRLDSASPVENVIYEYEITQQDTSRDIRTFSNSIVDKELWNKPKELRLEIANEIAQKCDGMFLWIRLVKDRLSQGKNQKQFKKEERDRAIAILRWTLFATRPLTVRELTKALLVDQDDDINEFPEEDILNSLDEHYANDQIRKLCGSLVVLWTGEAKDSVYLV